MSKKGSSQFYPNLKNHKQFHSVNLCLYHLVDVHRNNKEKAKPRVVEFICIGHLTLLVYIDDNIITRNKRIKSLKRSFIKEFEIKQ